ncbi:MAG: anti-sigma factor [Gammaproteobacteria bacterium]
MTIADDTLMAYADGELDAAAASVVEAEIAINPTTAERVSHYRRQRTLLKTQFDSVLTEPVPSHLVAAALGIPTIAPRRRWALPELGAMAASLLLGVVDAWGLLRGDGSEPAIVANGAGLEARGALAHALSEDLAAADGTVAVGLSFRDRSGNYCRTFTLTGADPTAGLACRGPDGWQIQMATRAAGDAPGTTYRPAGSAMPEALRHAVEQRIAGEPLDAKQESAARDRGWRD